MIRPPFSGLRVRLIAVVLVAVLPAFGLILYTAMLQRRAATGAAQQEALLLARLVARAHEDLIDQTRVLLLALVEAPAVRQGDGPTCTRLFADLKARLDAYSTIFLLARDGSTVCSAIARGPVRPAAGLPWFEEAIRAPGFTVSDYRISSVTGRAQISVSYPVRDDAGQVRGVLFAAIDVSRLGEIARKVGLPPDAAFAVTDSKGTVLARHPDPEAWVGRQVAESPLFRHMGERAEGVLDATGITGMRRLWGFAAVQGTGKPRLHVAVGFSADMVLREANRVLRDNLIGLGVVTALALGLAWLAGDLLVLRRVKALVRATRRLAEGDLGARTGQPEGQGELAELARAFDEMAARLEARQAEVERATSALRRERDYTQNLIDTANVMVVGLDAAGRVEVFNEAAEKITGYTRAEVEGRNWFDLVVPRDRYPHVWEEFSRLMADGVPRVFENPVLTRSGEERWIAWQNGEIRDGDRVMGTISFGIDTTELRRAEAAVRASEQRLTQALRAARAGAWEWDMRSNRARWSAENYLVLGLTPGSVEAGHEEWLQRVHPEDRAQAEARVAAAVESRGDLDFEFRVVWPDGTVRWIRDVGRMVLDPAGTPVAMYGIQIDVTESKLAELERRRAAAALVRRERQQAAVAVLGQRALEGAPLAALMDEAVARVAETLEAEYCKVLELLPGGEALRLVAGVGWQDGLVGRATVGAGRDSQAGYTLLSSDPVIVDDLRTETRFSGPALLHDHEVVSGLSVVIQRFGVLGVHTTRRREFTKDDVHFVAAVANVLAQAIDRERTHRELVGTKTLLEKTFASLEEAVFVADPATRTILACNQAAERMFGYPAAEMLGRNTEFLYVDRVAYEAFGRTLVAALDRDGVCRDEHEMRRRDGSPFSTENTVTQILDSSGRRMAFVSIFRDVTDRKRAEETTQRYVERLKVLNDIDRGILAAEAPEEIAAAAVRHVRRLIPCERVGVALFDLDTHEATVLAVGVAGETRLGAGARLPLAEWGEAVAALREGRVAFRTLTAPIPGGPVRHEAWFEGVHHFVHVPLTAGEGLVGALNLGRATGEAFSAEHVQIAREVADQLAVAIQQAQMTAALRQYAERLHILNQIDRSILAAESAEAIAEAALRHIRRLIPCRRVAVALYDYEAGESVRLALDVDGGTAFGLGARVALDPVIEAEQREGRIYQLLDTAEVGRPSPPIAMLTAEGVRAFASVPLIAHGGLIGALTLAHDRPGAFPAEHLAIAREVADQLAVAIQQARLRDEVQRHAAELEARVVARTAELQGVNAELEAFASTVSHDLRAPLTSVRGFSQALLEDCGDGLDETGQDYARRIATAAGRMDDLIQDLLAYSRLGRANLELERVDLGTVVSEALAQIEGELTRCGGQTSVDGHIPSVVGHRVTLVQVVANLVGNGAKFVMPGVTPVVKIRADSRDGWVRLWVEDNGIGIAPEHRERIFRPFERLHGRDTYPGTGIGLAIVQKAITRMGGQVGVESEVGRGSQFWVELPAAEGPR